MGMGRWSIATLVAASTVSVAVSASAQQTRTININSLPAGAQVRLDSQAAAPLGVTPLRGRRVPVGPHTLYFSLDGYVPGQIQVNVARNNETFTGTLTQAGSVYVSSDPDGAEVTIDGNPVGTTPRRVNNLPPGQHIVEVRREGSPTFRETVTVGAGALATVNAQLRPAAPTTGTVRVVVSNPNGALPADLAVTLDGAALTGSPPASDQVQPGTHIVQVSAGGFRTTRREIQVTGGQTMALAVDLEPVAAQVSGARVRVLANTQGAQVSLDGEVLEGNPPQRQGVAPGTHVLRVTAPGRVALTREITVNPGQAELNVNVNDEELRAAPQVGRIRVVTSTPGAQISIDGEAPQNSPVERNDVRFGEHVVRIRAQGFADYEQRCNVTAERPCEVVDPALQAARQTASLTVALTNPNVPNATVQVNSNPPIPVGELTGLPVGSAQVTVSAPGYQPSARTVNLQPGANAQSFTLVRIGPSGSDVARRRSAISTFGAAPLTRGDGAIDIIASYGALPAEFRATLGFMPHGLFAVDGGLGIRIMGIWNEFELRSRFGVRLLEDVLAVGGELRVYGAFGADSRRGVGVLGQINVSLNFSVASDEEAAGEPDAIAQARNRANRFGSFSITLSGGFEHNADSAGDYNPTLTQSGRLFSLCGNTNERNRIQNANIPRPPSMQQAVPQCEAGSSTRSFLGLNVEFGLARHWNVFAGLTYYLTPIDNLSEVPDPTGAIRTSGQLPQAQTDAGRRWVTTDLWGTLTPVAVRLGVTYKF